MEGLGILQVLFCSVTGLAPDAESLTGLPVVRLPSFLGFKEGGEGRDVGFSLLLDFTLPLLDRFRQITSGYGGCSFSGH